MKTPYLALAALALPLITAAQAETLNYVTISGSFIRESTPVVQNSTNFQSSTSTLLRTGFTNSAILDAMVANEDITQKAGYTIVEIFDNGGDSIGFFAYRASDGSLVEVSSNILSSFETNGEVSSSASTSRQYGQNTTNTETINFSGIAGLTVLNAGATAFYNGSAFLVNSTYSSVTVQAIAGYYVTSYVANIRGSNEGELLDAVIISSGGIYKTNLLLPNDG